VKESRSIIFVLRVLHVLNGVTRICIDSVFSVEEKLHEDISFKTIHGESDSAD